MKSMDTRLSVVDLRKSYKTSKTEALVIENLTFDVYPGEVVCIVGPSGVGKTTLLRCIAGLQPLTSGAVKLDGVPISGPPEGMALVFQDYNRSLMPWLSVEKNVAFPLKSKKLSREEKAERIKSAISAVGLSGSESKFPWQLSGGMQQRVAIARAIAYRPEILIMDEPFASVDAQTRFELEDLCLKVRDEFGITVLLVTHDIDEAVYMSDRIVVIGKKPAVVTETIQVPLPAQRDQITTRETHEFTQTRSHVLELVQKAH